MTKGYRLLILGKVFVSYFALWRNCYFPIRISMMYCCSMCDHDALMSVLCFIDTFIPKHVDMFWVLVFAWGQARSKLGGVDTSILHHAFMLIFIAFWAVILLVVPYLCLFSLILQGLFEEGEFRQLEFWTGKGENPSPLFCTSPNALKSYVDFFGII